MDLSQSINSQDVVEDEDVDEPTATPLWKYVPKISNEMPNSKSGGGFAKFICNSGCKLEAYAGIQLCLKVNKTERELLKQEELDAQQLFLGNAKARKFPRFTLTSQVQSQTIRSSDVPRSVKVSIDNMFHVRNREEVYQMIARCHYSNDIAFNVVRSLWWANMVTAINDAPKGYKSPNYEKVRTNLLDKEQHKVQQSLNPLMQDWSIHGVSIVSDGWSNLKNQTLINIMAISGVIEFVGPSNAVQAVTDNATNYKAAGAIIQLKLLSPYFESLDEDIVKCEDPALLFVDKSYKRDSDKAVIGEVYVLMDIVLGNIKDTLSNDLIDKMNIPLYCLAYILVHKYYTNSWLSKSAPGGVRRLKPRFDVEVQKGYLKAIETMICDQTKAAVIRKQIINDRATVDALSWWHLYGGAAPELYSLALKVLSQKDANIEEDIMAIEERDNVSLSDSEDDTTLAASDVQPCLTPTPLPTSSSFPPPTSQEHSMEQVVARRRLEKAWGKRQKK
ncbi:hypothetical protein ACSBR2_026747 [Camellia fascicularis]